MIDYFDYELCDEHEWAGKGMCPHCKEEALREDYYLGEREECLLEKLRGEEDE